MIGRMTLTASCVPGATDPLVAIDLSRLISQAALAASWSGWSVVWPRSLVLTPVRPVWFDGLARPIPP